MRRRLPVHHLMMPHHHAVVPLRHWRHRHAASRHFAAVPALHHWAILHHRHVAGVLRFCLLLQSNLLCRRRFLRCRTVIVSVDSMRGRNWRRDKQAGNRCSKEHSEHFHRKLLCFRKMHEIFVLPLVTRPLQKRVDLNQKRFFATECAVFDLSHRRCRDSGRIFEDRRDPQSGD